MLIDFEKAFDSLSWNFIYECLNFLTLVNQFNNGQKVFYKNSSSSIIQNGIVSENFKPGRGCRQGDPISPYLFIICAEILGIFIRNNRDIKGIKINGEEYKILQYSDDMSLLTDGSPQSLDGILQTLDFLHVSQDQKFTLNGQYLRYQCKN